MENDKLILLGERIKKAREKQGLTQEQLAYSIGKDQPSINRVEKGKINPSYLYLLELADGLGVSVKELLG
ncbi:MAG: helix-turn-helix transcriptional regulator [Ekhidna sp.]